MEYRLTTHDVGIGLQTPNVADAVCSWLEWTRNALGSNDWNEEEV